jgi:uncharacterized membrane protein YcaP (DUF421 family)
MSVEQILDITLRSAVIYLSLVLIFRLAGKRHVSQLSLFDFVLILLVANAVQNAMVGEDTTLGGGIIAALTLVILNIILTKLSVRSSRLSKLLEGEPKLIVRNGKILEKKLRDENLRREEVLEAVRKAGFAGLDEVGFAILESDGTISVINKEEAAKSKNIDISAS